MNSQKIKHRIFCFKQNIRYLFSRVNISLFTYVDIARTSQFKFGKSLRIRSRILKISPNSNLILGDNAVIEGNIIIGENCSITIGDNFKLIGANLIVSNSSRISIGKDCLFTSVFPYTALLEVTNGLAKLGDNTNIRARIIIDGGELVVGSNTFINQGSEIRCEESIEIGNYVYISYLVDIFDTNTHPTKWEERRLEVDSGYPNRALRQVRPKTAPIKLGDFVWIGKMAAILKGCQIGAKSIVGTRAVVTNSCPEESLLTGNPAVSRNLES